MGGRALKRIAALAALAAAGLGLPGAALATVTIEPVFPWTIFEGKIHFQDSAGSPNMDDPEGFRAISLSTGLADDSAGRPNIIEFDVTSDKTFGADGKVLVVQIFVKAEDGTTQIAIPIARKGGIDAVADCTDTTCQLVQDIGGTRYYRAVQSNVGGAVTKLRVGIYARDICLSTFTLNSSNVAKGCEDSGTDDLPDSPTSTSATSFTLTFAVGLADPILDPTAGGLTLTDAAVDKSAELALQLHNSTPTISCPSMANVYFPADSAIILNTAFTGGQESGGAPVDTLMMVSKLGSLANITFPSSNWNGGNSFVARMPLNTGGRLVSGFTNTTDGTDGNFYGLGFAVRDRSGRMSAFGATDPSPQQGDCQVPNVRTAAVQGAIGANNCFIATAAFGSRDAAPVRLLREFRDRVLLPTAAGRAFTSWYYSWSPRAADWLEGRPAARGLVLALLLPLELAALLALNPLAAAFGLAVLLAVAGGLVVRARRAPSGWSR